MSLNYSTGTRDAQQQGLITYAGSGAIIHIYDGTQPVNANTGVTTQTLLVSLAIVGTFGTDSNGVITISSVNNGTAVATGTATWFRITKSDNSTVIMDGSVGTSGADMNLSSTGITVGQVVSITSGTITRNNG